MKKLVLLFGVVALTYSCKKDCNCIVVQEVGKIQYVKGQETMVWSIVDTVGVETNCSLDGNVSYTENTLRTRTICD